MVSTANQGTHEESDLLYLSLTSNIDQSVEILPCQQQTSATEKATERVNDSDLREEIEEICSDGAKANKRTAGQIEETSCHFSCASSSDLKMISRVSDHTDFSDQFNQTALKSKRRRSSADANYDEKK